MPRGRAIACSLALGALVGIACASIGGPANPFVPEERFVTSVEDRGGFLDTVLTGQHDERRFFFPRTANCAAALQPEARVEYSARGRFGQVNSPDPEGDPCIPMGVGTLRIWRDRQPRPQSRGGTASPLPRRPTFFRTVGQDEREILLRGQFPLATWIGMAPAHDLIAFVPNTEACQRVVADGQATLEYRFTGQDVFRLTVPPPDRCPVVAFSAPPPESVAD